MAAIDAFLKACRAAGATIDCAHIDGARHGDVVADESPRILGALDAAFGR